MPINFRQEERLMKVVLTSLLTDDFTNDLRATFPDVEFVTATSEQEQKAQIKDADVYLGMPSREVFVAADRLRWIHCPGTGIDSVSSMSELVNSDVVLTNARGPHTNPMADHAFGMIIGLAHGFRELFEDQKAHHWDTRKYDQRVAELGGSTMGILALGGIGSAVARRAFGFGMNVYAVDKNPVPPSPGVSDVWGLDRLDDLLKVSDWFVIAAPLTSETRGLIDRRRVELLKEGAYVVAISRGGIIDEDALLDGLRSGRIAGAGLDVTAVEPLPSDNPLWDMPNVIISPHSSALTTEMWDGRRDIFKENLRRFLANEPFLYVCDKTDGF
jgi:phosphoglycerate dehydrogenase-like enzyme